MMIDAELSGLKIGKVSVLRRSPARRDKWECMCECGRPMLVSVYRLVEGNGRRMVTGCNRCAYTTHGMLGTKVYKAWNGALERCRNQNNDSFKHYGGRGIRVCEEWAKSFEAFYRDMGDPPAGMSLERKDVNKGYSKDNCKWATAQEQGRNKRYNALVSYQGYTATIVEWSERAGVNAITMYARKKKGWPDHEVIEGRVPRNFKMVTLLGRTQNLAAWCRELDCDHAQICREAQRDGSYTEPLKRRIRGERKV